jgi:putative serine protease PepD
MRRPATKASPWWSDALADPWRDPTTPTEIVVPARAEPDHPPPVEPVEHSTHRPGRVVAMVLVTAMLTGVVAGALGGVLGYTYASRGTGTVLGTGAGEGPAAQMQHPPESMAEVVDRVLPSVVTVRSSNPGGRNLGSGFVISTDGFLLTNDHVIGPAVDAITVTFHDGSQAPASVAGRDPESDLAVLRVDRGGLSPVHFGDSEAVAVGDPVLAVGSPLALANTVTSGIVSAVDRAIGTGRPGGPVRYYAAIQTDAAVNQGNSGGPLVDAAGQVVGVNAMIKSVAASESGAGSIGLAFAIPIRQAKRVAGEIIDTGRASRTVFGAELEPPAARQRDGVRLVSVVDGGPAARAGMRAGDVVLSLDGVRLEAPTELVALVRKHDPGSVVMVEYRRGTSRATAPVRLVADR